MSMSMSTRIDDLPGPIPQEVLGNIQDIQNSIRQDQQVQQDQLEREAILRQNTIQNSQPIPVSPEVYKTTPQTSNIKATIKRHVTFKDESQVSKDILSLIKEEINEENLLLLIIMVFSSRNDFDGYIRGLPFIGSYSTNNDFITLIVRCLVLLIVYIVIKEYVLPKVRM